MSQTSDPTGSASPPDLVIHGGRVVGSRGVVEADVVVSGERIVAVGGPGPTVEARQTVEAKGLYVLPGAIDPHLHCRMFSLPMVDDFQAASIGAAFGGVTTVIPFVGGPEGMSLPEALEQFAREGDSASVVDFAMHARLRPDPRLIEQVPDAIARGVTSIKMFQAYRKRGLLFTDDLLLKTMELTAAHGGLALVHAENGFAIDYLEDSLIARGQTGPEHYLRSRPHWTETEAVARAAGLAALMGCTLYVVHLSTREGLDEIRRARGRGQEVYAETCPQYLFLTDAEMRRQKGLAKIAPPLRWDTDREALWDGLRRGDVQTIGSDHAPFALADKEAGAADIFAVGFGMPGVETMVPLLASASLDGSGLSMPELAAALSENAARIFGLYPRKGAIEVGADADIVLLDPNAQWTVRAADLHSHAGYTCFEGWTVRGRIVASFLRGRPLVKDGRLCQRPGYGVFLPRKARAA